ncbi:MAG: hypothetical protein JOY61_16025 [Chloroflexi bacterium]|nr:hypothetical protein [Chloroflexota bacterium]
MDDLLRQRTGAFMRQYCGSEEEFVQKVCSLPPQAIGEIRFGFSPVWGELISVMCMPHEMCTARGCAGVVEAMGVAVQRGARVIGLGALTSPATGGGLRLLRHVPPGVTITTGNAFTAAVVRRNVLEASTALGFDRRAQVVAVVGCTGSVGVAVTQLLAQDGFRLILIGRSGRAVEHRLGDVVQSDTQRITTAGDPAAAARADIVVLLTNDPTAELEASHVRPRAIVIDCAQPRNVSLANVCAMRQQEVTVVEGGLVQIPGYTCTYDFGLPKGGWTFACLAETYLFARNSNYAHSVGRAEIGTAQCLEAAAARRGVGIRPLLSTNGKCLLPIR